MLLNAEVPMIKATIIFVLFLASPLHMHGQEQAARLLLERAQNEYARGNYSEAIQLFDECLKAKPSVSDAYSGRAASKAELKDLVGALTDYSITLELVPEDYGARLGRANVLFKLKRYEEARRDYTKLLSLETGETNMVYFQKSASPSGTMQITTAQSDFRPVIYNYLGLTEYRLNNFQKARVWLDSAISLHPKEADYYVNRGLVREKLGDRSAVEDYHRALRINKQHTAALSALASLSNESSNREALLTNAIESDTTSTHPYLERAYLRMQKGMLREALSDYDQVLRIDGNDPEIWLNRGYVKEKLNDLAGAFSDFTRAISLEERYAKAWLNRGNVLQKQGKLMEAMEDYTVAITYEPEYAAAFYNRAIVRQKLKQKNESCSDLKKAESLGMTVDQGLKNQVCE
jgi:tetratricopeptide (TPR) repeat protein